MKWYNKGEWRQKFPNRGRRIYEAHTGAYQSTFLGKQFNSRRNDFVPEFFYAIVVSLVFWQDPKTGVGVAPCRRTNMMVEYRDQGI